MYNPDKISVSEGSSFSITCSIHSQYSGGLFLLRKSNQNITEPKPAFGHALFYVATFDFSVINYKDQGDYDCLYTVNISSLLFSSVPSKSLQITVAGQFIFLEYSQHRFELPHADPVIFKTLQRLHPPRLSMEVCLDFCWCYLQWVLFFSSGEGGAGVLVRC